MSRDCWFYVTVKMFNIEKKNKTKQQQKKKNRRRGTTTMAIIF